MQVDKMNGFGHFVNACFIVVSILMVLPILLLVSSSFSSENSLLADGYHFWPAEFSLAAYAFIFKSPGQLLNAYAITIVVTVLGTLISLLFTAMLAYVISRRDFAYRKSTTVFIFLTMMFNGGLVPTYIMITQYLHLKNTLWVMILPMVLSPFLVMVLKGFFGKLPTELYESAEIDGSGEWRIFFQLVIPLSTPALATAAVIISFGFWNEWFLAFLYVSDRDLTPLQLLLIRMLNDITFLREHVQQQQQLSHINMKEIPGMSIRLALTVLVAGPMLMVFPFFQRYFVKGLTLGSLK